MIRILHSLPNTPLLTAAAFPISFPNDQAVNRFNAVVVRQSKRNIAYKIIQLKSSLGELREEDVLYSAARMHYI